jgi:hypothetical protein
MNSSLFLSTMLQAAEEVAHEAAEGAAHESHGPTFPMFLAVLFGAIGLAAALTWLSSRGGDSHH